MTDTDNSASWTVTWGIRRTGRALVGSETEAIDLRDALHARHWLNVRITPPPGQDGGD